MIRVIFALLSLPIFCFGQDFELTSHELIPSYGGVIRWADLDSDNDLDLIYNGFSETSDAQIKVYKNEGGHFISQETNLPGIRNGMFDLADLDNDNDLDIALSGLGNSGNISVVYENKGNFSFELKQSLPGLINATVSWADMDNDNDPDLLIAGVDDTGGGEDPFVEWTYVYENKNAFLEEKSGTNLPACTQCSIDWADSNGDDFLDVIITGFRDDNLGHTQLFINTGAISFSESSTNFPGLYNGDVKWGDFDNDLDPDILLSGVTSNGTIQTTVFENKNGAGFTQRTDITIASVGENWFNGTSWKDINRDGMLDLIVSGRGVTVVEVFLVFKVYLNNGDGTFTESSFELTGLTDSSIDVEDYNQDGYPDICFIGLSSAGVVCGIYKNLNGSIMDLPLDHTTTFQLYPNPFNDSFSIEISDFALPLYTIIVQDLIGKDVARYTVNDTQNVLSGSELKPGVYLISLEKAGIKQKTIRAIKN